MAVEIPTMAIPKMIQEAEETGLITDDSLKALEAKKLQAQEKIENQIKKFNEGKISHKEMVERTTKIRKDIQDLINTFDDNL